MLFVLYCNRNYYLYINIISLFDILKLCLLGKYVLFVSQNCVKNGFASLSIDVWPASIATDCVKITVLYQTAPSRYFIQFCAKSVVNRHFLQLRVNCRLLSLLCPSPEISKFSWKSRKYGNLCLQQKNEKKFPEDFKWLLFLLVLLRSCWILI